MRRHVNAKPYPEQIDCTWLASDRDGHLGAFMTAGEGPIPAAALDCAGVSIEAVEQRLCQLPLVSQAWLLVPVPRPDDFVDLARRGLFVYDWTDSHRTTRKSLHVYERVAAPSTPLTVTALPFDLAALAGAIRFADAAFATDHALDVRQHLICIESQNSNP
jgi:hypothetical protein